MSEVKEPLLNHWYRALSSACGIELVCTDPESTKSKLYSARREAKDRDLDRVSLTISPFDPQKLWLVKKNETP